MDTPGDPHTVLRRLPIGRYLRLDQMDRFIWEHLDGERRVLDVARAFTATFGQIGLFRVLDVVNMFDNAGLLDDGVPDRVWEPTRTALHRRTLSGRTTSFNRAFINKQWPRRGLDGLFARLYRYGGRLFFTRVAVAIMTLFTFAGIVTWRGLAHPNVASLDWRQLGAVFGVAIGSLVVHELGHAMAVQHFGRRVSRAGLMVLYGTPGAFVDTSDMWLGTKRQRLLVTASGPVVNLLIGAGFAFAASTSNNSTLAAVASSQFLLVVANATPMLKLDGYYILMDAIGIANLRERALAFIGAPLKRRCRAAWDEGSFLPRFSRDEWYLFTFGAAYTVWLIMVGIAGLLVLPVRIWNTSRDAMLVGTKSVLGMVLAASVIFVLGFAVLQLVAGRKRIVEMVVLIGRRIDRTTRRGGLVTTLLIVVVCGVMLPWLAGTRSSTAEKLWAHLLPVSLCALAAVRSWQVALSARGSKWRTVFGSTSIGVAVISFGEVGMLINSPLSTAMRWIGFGVVMTGLVVGGRPLLGSMQGTLVACWVPLAIGLVALTIPGGAQHFGALAIGVALLVGARVFRRPFFDRRSVADIPTTDPLGGRRESTHLRRGFGFLAEHLAEEMGELFGKGERVAFFTAANTALVDGGWPMWFVESGTLVDRVDGPMSERAAIYRAALGRLVGVAGMMSDRAVAVDAIVAARLLLPTRLGALVDEHIGCALADHGYPSLRLEMEMKQQSARFALRHVVRAVCRCVDEAAGAPAVERIVATANRRAASNGWGVWCRSNGQVADGELALVTNPDDVAAGFLAVVCSSAAEALGTVQCRRAVQFALDTLSRDLYPVALRLLGTSPWVQPPDPRAFHPVVIRSWPIAST